MKVVLLTNMIPPYRVEFFRELSHICDLTVVCDSLTSPLREWKQDPKDFGFTYLELGEEGVVYTHERPDAGFDEQRIRHKGKGVIKVLKSMQPDIVITCEFGMRSLYTYWYSLRQSVPYIIWSEGTRYTEKAVRGTRKAMRQFLARRASGFWTNGTASRNYLEDIGAKSDTISEGMTGISTHTYRDAGLHLASERVQLRSDYKIEGACLLFVGAISERKGVIQLMKAIEQCDSQLTKQATFIIAGSGPLQEEAEDLQSRLSSINLVFPGFQNEEGIQKLFAASDVFVMPTLDDNWPLVTIEAMVSGLPQIGSIYNGASEDLAQKKEVGVFIDPHDSDRLAEVLLNGFENPPARLSRSVVEWATEYYSPREQAKRALEIIRRVGQN